MDLSEADLLLIVRIETSFALAGYLDSALDQHATQSIDDLRAQLEGQGRAVDRSTADFILWDAEDEHRSFREVTRSAVFLSIWASFELALTDYLEAHVGGAPESRLRVRDFRGGTLDGIKTFLRKVVRRDLDLSRAGWAQIAHLRRIRNHLAHSTVFVDPTDERLRE